MANEFPSWHPEAHPDFDAAMTTASVEILDRLRDDPVFRSSILEDPQVLHRHLYKHFVPPSHPEYAGTYRGTLGTSLEHRIMGGPSVIQQGKTFNFREPAGVPDATERLLADVRTMIARAATPWEQLWALTNLFARFGAIHPFLDGNGHVQRALFSAAALEMGLQLSNRFAIHPRSYDFLLAFALETFTRSNTDDQRSQWAMAVAEYLAQWLAGPFDAPGSGLPPL